jgi:hypothetical protein
LPAWWQLDTRRKQVAANLTGAQETQPSPPEGPSRVVAAQKTWANPLEAGATMEWLGFFTGLLDIFVWRICSVPSFSGDLLVNR